MYTKRIRPGLTKANRQKQIDFSLHVHNRWGVEGNRKILWTMSDEKWWFGLVARTFAKMCPALGIKKEVFAVHHKKHIAKVYQTDPIDVLQRSILLLFLSFLT